MEQLQIGRYTLTWLDGGVIHLDGGAMFGVVPKPLWEKKYPPNEKNQIELRTDPVLIDTGAKKFLLETGIGTGRFSEKQKRNFGVAEESRLERSLERLGISCAEIEGILMTHLHFDHACGLSRFSEEGWKSVFPGATIYCSVMEWEEMKNPTIRSLSTYWESNWRPVAGQIRTFEGEMEVYPGIRLVQTGGHSRGHAAVIIESRGEMAIHLGDLLPTHAHQNPLWVMAYDDYPMDSIREKQKWISIARRKEAWLTFYHDAFFRALKWNEKGERIGELVKAPQRSS